MISRSLLHRWALAIPFLCALIFFGAQEAHLWGYVLSGSSWSGTTVPYRINPNFTDPAAGTPTQQIAAIQAAANEWQLFGGSSFSFVYQGTTTSTATGADGVNTISYSNVDGNGSLAICFWWSSAGVISDFDIKFYDRDGTYDWAWSTSPAWNEFDIQSVACHELGHALGLAHSANMTATMYPAIPPGSTAMRSLHVDDMAGVQAIYGQAPPPAPTITSVVPAEGWVDGGETATVSGSDFFPGTISVLFNGLSAGNIAVIDSSTLTCTVPPGQGQHAVDVAVMSGSIVDTMPGAFTYNTLRSFNGHDLAYMWNTMEIVVPEDAGKTYRAVLSTSPGLTPMSAGDPSDLRMFPMTWSQTFHWSLYDEVYDLPYWSLTVGQLDPAGRAVFGVWGLNHPTYAGLELHVTFFIVDQTAPSNISTIGNVITVAYQYVPE